MRLFSLIMGAVMAITSPALAEDCEAPCAAMTATFEFDDGWIFAADRQRLRSNTLQPDFEIESWLALSETLKLVNTARIEQVIDPDPGRSSAFEDVGLYLSELYAELELDPVTLRAGKIEPAFSSVNVTADGLNSADITANADVGESLGIAAAAGFEAFGFDHTLTGTAFTRDRSVLASSLMTSREVPKLSGGGAGNASGISSYSLAVDGCKGAGTNDCYEEGHWGYRLAARYQRAGRKTPEGAEKDASPHDEIAVLWGANAKVKVDDRVLRLLGEGAFISHFEGSSDDALILSGVAALSDGPFVYSAALSRQWNFVSSEADTKENLVDLAIRYSPEGEEAASRPA